MQWFVDAELYDVLTDRCLIKLASVSVHRTYVPRSSCFFALSDLQSACVKNTALKQELAKVLLGFSTNGENSIFTVMQDLRDDGFVALDHQKVRRDGKLPELWTAFCGLVESLLLPMAHHNVVHVDIRSTARTTYNILCRYCSSNEIELRLIDFDSLTPCDWISSDSPTRQDHSVHWDNMRPDDRKRVPSESAPFRHLFWQILWIAFTWHPTAAKSSDNVPKLPSGRHFVRCLWNGQHFGKFKKWLGHDTVETLKMLHEPITTEATVLAALDALGAVFCGPTFPKKRPRSASPSS
jgi:hypothetical protein